MKDTIAEFLNMKPMPALAEVIESIKIEDLDSSEILGYIGPDLSGENHPLWGTNHSEETRKKISETQKKRYAEGLHPWIGRSHSEESKASISMARKGVKLSEEHKKKIGKGRKGKVQSEETRAKIAAAMKGKKNSLGVKRSEETRAKIAAARRGKKFPRS